MVRRDFGGFLFFFGLCLLLVVWVSRDAFGIWMPGWHVVCRFFVFGGLLERLFGVFCLVHPEEQLIVAV